MDGQILLETQGLTKKFDGLTAVDQVDFRLRAGEKVGIIGPNGAGKTTFFNLLTGLHSPSSGRIFHVHSKREEITGVPPHLRVEMGIIRTFQLVSVFNSLNVLDNLVLANVRFSKDYLSKRRFYFKRSHAPEIVERCLEALAVMGLESKSGVRTQELSYGDKRKLEIGIALSLGPRILLLDEPFAGLSDAEIDELLHLIRRLCEAFALIIIEHKISRIVDLVDRLNVMHEGRMIAEGPPGAVLKDPMVREVYWGKEEALQCSLN